MKQQIAVLTLSILFTPHSLFTSDEALMGKLFETIQNNKFGHMTELLKKNNFDLNDQNNLRQETPLICAVRNKCRLIGEKLISRGVNLNAQDKFGRTAAHWAAQMPDSYILELLIKAQAKLTLEDTLGLTAQQYASPTCQALLHDIDDYKRLFLSEKPVVSFYSPEQNHKDSDEPMGYNSMITFLKPYASDPEITIDHLNWIFRSPDGAHCIKNQLRALQRVIRSIECNANTTEMHSILNELSLDSTLLDEVRAFERVKKILHKTENK